jgi:hypothetical protein
MGESGDIRRFLLFFKSVRRECSRLADLYSDFLPGFKLLQLLHFQQVALPRVIKHREF